VAGKVRHEDAAALDQRGQQLDPVEGAAAQPVEEHERLSRAAGEVPEVDPGGLRTPLLEPRHVRCGRHADEVS
jgi:hypothetical protein